MAKAILRKFSFPLIASVFLACLPSPVFAQRGGGGGGFRGGGFAGGFRGGVVPGGSIRGGGSFGGSAFRGVGPGVSGGTYGRSGGYSRAYQSPTYRSGFSRMSRGGPYASGPRSSRNADGQWHSFSASRGGSVGRGSGNEAAPARSGPGESEWRSFGNHSSSSGSPFRGSAMAAHQPSSNPPATSANVASTASALKTGAPSQTFGFDANSVIGSWRFGSNLMASNLSGFNRFGFNNFSFNHFGFGCFGCGFNFSFGVRFGFGWPWGWGSWWGPSWGWGWWNPFWFTPWYYPWWGWNVGYYPPPAIVYSGPLDQPSNNSPSDSPAPSNRPTNPPSPSKLPASPPSASEIAQRSEPTTNNGENAAIRLYLKDGDEYSVRDCWMAYGKVHYTFGDGDESAVDINQLDLQRTLDENSQHLCTVHETEPINPTLSTERK